MKLDDYIAELEKLRQEVGGEVRVVESVGYMAPLGAIRDPRHPTVETLQVKSARESYEKIYNEGRWAKTPAIDSKVKVVLL